MSSDEEGLECAESLRHWQGLCDALARACTRLNAEPGMGGRLQCDGSRSNTVRIDNPERGVSVTVRFSAESREVTVGDHGPIVYQMLTDSSSHVAYFTRDGGTSFGPDGMATRILKDVG
jgi:hypothetical protein